MTPPTARLHRIIGHRGAAACAPENTLVSLATAARVGARQVEFDVRLSRDGSLVLVHDATLDRTTNGSGLVAETSDDVLARLDAGSWFGAGFAGEGVPQLPDTLRLLDRLGLCANIEIKADAGREAETAAVLIDVLDAHGGLARSGGDGRHLVSSLEPLALAVMAERAPALPRGLVMDAPDDGWPDRVRELGCGHLHVDHVVVDAAFVRRVGVELPGVLLGAYTVNEPERAARLFELGVRAIFTDDPARLLSTTLPG